MDRNEFFVSLCGAVNRRDGIGGRTWVRDLSEPNWRRDLASEYDVVVAVNAVHWFSLAKAAELFGDIFQLLRIRWSFSAYGTGRSGAAIRARVRGDGKRNSPASTSTKIGGASGRE